MNCVNCYNYWPGPGTIIEDVKKRLPSYIRADLMSGTPHTEFGIYVEASKHAIVTELDRLLGICSKRDFGKSRVYEVDKNSITDHEFFFIAPRALDYGRDIYFDINPPTCNIDTCPWGARIVSPVRINPKCLKGLGIAYVTRHWRFKEIELVVSETVRSLFDSENVTGLEYEQCCIAGDNGESEEREVPAYFARITNGTYQFAKEIVTGANYCSRHSSVITPYPFGLWTPHEALGSSDFQKIDTLRVKGKDYYYGTPWWIISRKTLHLLLKHRVRLKQATIFLKECFRPFLTDDGQCS